MKSNSEQPESISRRRALPIFASALLFPFLGFGRQNNNSLEADDSDEKYHTLLKPDGTVVKVKVNTLKKSKVLRKRLSNNAMLKWLKNK